MPFDIILYLVFQIPLLWVIMKQDQLSKPLFFLKILSFSIILLFTGVIFLYNNKTSVNQLSYFGSQTTFVFLILYRIIRDIYFPIFLREPEISKKPKHRIDIIPTLLVFTGTISLPFIIDTYITQELFPR